MTDLDEIELPFDGLHDRRECDALWLVDEKEPVQVLEHLELREIGHECLASPRARTHRGTE